ncbi:Protein phosphatase 5 [Operophtera brumata]|uniref:Protein phosphatase 5 n=1 Tax=Operophtera brumata TaxID=104452 RepID=A0A0L7KNA7_OPEBR|nr:Protein phosphatase 5 [Operophtera brumata]
MAEVEEIRTPSEEDIKEADILKTEANDFFKRQMYDQAIELYTKAIGKNPNNAVYFANRSISNLRLENFGYALNDASKSIELDRSYTKAYYRRAAAHMSLGKYKLALKDFEYIVKRIAFEAAIAVDRKEVNIADSINLDAMKLMEHFKQQKKLHKKYAFKVEVPPTGKFTVCGDIHGQYYDLMNIFEMNGLPSETNPYLFNGDFVDRGSFSVECNHETIDMNRMYGFRGEVTSKYSSQMADLFTEVYNWLPLAHCIMCELLWSDPQHMSGRAPSKRGVGCQFGPDVTAAFLAKNKLDYIIRSHEV